MIWSLSNTRFKILWSLSLAQSAVKVEKSWNLKKSWHKLFRILRVRYIRQMFHLQCLIEKPRPDLLTQSTAFYDLSVSRDRVSKAEMRRICRIRNWGVKSRMFKHLNSDADPGFQPTWKTVKEYLTAVPSLLYQWNSSIINSVIKLHQFLMDVRSYPENI